MVAWHKFLEKLTMEEQRCGDQPGVRESCDYLGDNTRGKYWGEGGADKKDDSRAAEIRSVEGRLARSPHSLARHVERGRAETLSCSLVFTGQRTKASIQLEMRQ